MWGGWAGEDGFEGGSDVHVKDVELFEVDRVHLVEGGVWEVVD